MEKTPDGVALVDLVFLLYLFWSGCLWPAIKLIRSLPDPDRKKTSPNLGTSPIEELPPVAETVSPEQVRLAVKMRKLRNMTTAKGCTPGEARNAARILRRMKRQC